MNFIFDRRIEFYLNPVNGGNATFWMAAASKKQQEEEGVYVSRPLIGHWPVNSVVCLVRNRPSARTGIGICSWKKGKQQWCSQCYGPHEQCRDRRNRRRPGASIYAHSERSTVQERTGEIVRSR